MIRQTLARTAWNNPPSECVRRHRDRSDADTAARVAPHRDPRAGFTLVEMLVVLVIIGLIMGLVGPRVLSSLSDARSKTAKLQIEALGSSLDIFYLDTGRYPSSSEGLQALVTAPGNLNGWNGPYVKGGNVPLDPWGQAYTYRSPAQAAPYEIVSFGSSGREGGGTEIRSQGKR